MGGEPEQPLRVATRGEMEVAPVHAMGPGRGPEQVERRRGSAANCFAAAKLVGGQVASSAKRRVGRIERNAPLLAQRFEGDLGGG